MHSLGLLLAELVQVLLLLEPVTVFHRPALKLKVRIILAVSDDLGLIDLDETVVALVTIELFQDPSHGLDLGFCTLMISW